MQPQNGLKKIHVFFDAIRSKCALNRVYILLCFLLLVVFLFSFAVPILHFGRFFGTDDYIHLFHTQVMTSSMGMADFYQNMGEYVSDPSGGTNDYNYPFGMWLFGAILSKITGIPPVTAELLYVILFLAIVFGSFYFYAGVFLESKEEKILAVLFLVSMPSAAMDLLSFRPSVFILPFLFLLMYIVLKEPVRWRLFPLVWLSVFIITISHTGTFMFLFIFAILFFFLYCLLWGKYSLPMYVLILSTSIIYIISLTLFPEIEYQYDLKTKMLLIPGDFLAKNLQLTLPSELSTIFYQHIIIDVEFVYIIIFGALVFSLGKFFQYLHQKIYEKFTQAGPFFPVSLPITSMSKNIASAPFWIGPVHMLLTFFGFFKLDNKGKCVLISALLITLVPDIITKQSATGITREISFLVLIIPITAVLGLGAVISYLDSLKITRKNTISLLVWGVVLSAVIIPPTLATTYYLPTISGEDYIINGMKWLGNNGDFNEKVVGYGYRTVPIYTNMSDASYGVQMGNEETFFRNSLINTYYFLDTKDLNNLRQYFGVRYILESDKLMTILRGPERPLQIDNNPALDKVYSSKDFGIYDSGTFNDKSSENKFLAENISFERVGSSFRIQTDAYQVLLNGNYPVLEQFGPPDDNYFGKGLMIDDIYISGLRYPRVNPYLPTDESAEMEELRRDEYILYKVPVTPEINENQVTYRTILKDQLNEKNEATLLVRYTFYPKTIKRELLISNDWVNLSYARDMDVRWYTIMDIPLNNFMIKSDNGKTLQRYMYPSLDTVVKNVIIQDLYVYEKDRGVYIRNEPTANYPTTVEFKGSTLYDTSILVPAQNAVLKPGETMHVTQFLSAGDELTAEKNIQTRQGIRLLNYRNGTVPIMLLGYHTPYSGLVPNNTAEEGYRVIQDEGIPYSEVVVPELKEEIPLEQDSSTGAAGGNATPVIHEMDLQEIANEDIKIIGSGSTGKKMFYNVSSQDLLISALIDYINNQDASMIGYMPTDLRYNLDTLNSVSEKNIPFMISDAINAPYYGNFGVVNRDPQRAVYHGESQETVLLPISNPWSTELSTREDNTWVFSAWKATVDEAVSTDGMVLFLIRPEEIGHPEYTEDIRTLIGYAKNQSLTFTTPDEIVQYYKNIQNVQYSAFLDGDIATINLTNNNDNSVQGVTFRIVLPELKKGNYTVSGGTLVKTKSENVTAIVYVSTDITAHATKEITVQPDSPREMIIVTMPAQPTEGGLKISVTDSAGKPLKNADVIINSKYYKPDKDGYVNINLKRGVYQLTIKCPEFVTYSTTLKVKGRLYQIEQFLTK
jgi:hypothetical protein